LTFSGVVFDRPRGRFWSAAALVPHKLTMDILTAQGRVLKCYNTAKKVIDSPNVACGPHKGKPDQKDSGDQHHPKLEVNIPH
jgi:hypothetical protein